MLAEWQLTDLVELVRERYPGWDSFDHPGFVGDEIGYKREAAASVQSLLSETEMRRLIAGQQFEELINIIIQQARATNLLFNRVPRQGDAAPLYLAHGEPGELCLAIRDLLYGSGPSPARLDAFSAFCQRSQLPLKWPLPTYFLFMRHPDKEMFVKPEAARWLLQFMGQGEAYDSQVNGETYAAICRVVNEIGNSLTFYGARDMIDVQSFLRVAHRQSRQRTSGLKLRQQVELNVPPEEPWEKSLEDSLEDSGASPYHIGRRQQPLRESGLEFGVDDAGEFEHRQPYPLEQLAFDAGYEPEKITAWKMALERKKQAIFYGPPGTGKTHLAQAMARHLTAGSDGLVRLVQFHPSFSYEEFIQGIRPVNQPDGGFRYDLMPGRFLTFCEQARERAGLCVMIIDEINRANLSSVFGELMYLLEYREQAIQLAGGTWFDIPDNVRLIGTMNTADRSIALVDHALRRRFAFIQLSPNYDLLARFHQNSNFPIDQLIDELRAVNRLIDDPHYEIGVAYFLRKDLSEQFGSIWQTEIEPYLEEYFFSQPDRITPFRWQQVKERLSS